MKTTEEQRAELRRLADSRSVLKWPELIDLLDDLAALEAENERLKQDSYFALYKSAKERVFAVEQERDALKEQSENRHERCMSYAREIDQLKEQVAKLAACMDGN